jgi:hypothetical protein
MVAFAVSKEASGCHPLWFGVPAPFLKKPSARFWEQLIPGLVAYVHALIPELGFI